jgi:hypothetical protein
MVLMWLVTGSFPRKTTLFAHRRRIENSYISSGSFGSIAAPHPSGPHDAIDKELRVVR